MSHYVDISFKRVDTCQDFLDTIQAFNKTLSSQMKQVINENFYFLVGEHGTCSYHGFRAIIKGLFLSKFIYWPEYSTMALFGGWAPNSIREEVFGNVITFQNSTDPGISMDAWPNIPFIQNIISDVKLIPDMELLPKDEDLSDCTEQELAEIAQQKRDMVIYNRISDAIGLRGLIYGSEKNPAIFQVQALTSDYDVAKAVTMFRFIMKEKHTEVVIQEEHLECVSLVKGTRCLTKTDISFEQDINQLGDQLDFYMPCWFDTKSVFGLDFEKDDDQYINIYAYYDMKNGQALYHLSIILHDVDSTKEMAYILNEEEHRLIAEAMNAHCLKQTGMSITDYVKSLK